MRELMCVSLLSSVDIQDASSDVIRSRASSISKLLVDLSQLSNSALSNCTKALLRTLEISNGFADSATYSSASLALSSILESHNISPLPDTIIDMANAITSMITLSIQSTLLVSESPQSIVSKNLRAVVAVVDGSSTLSLSPPQTDIEKLNQNSVTSIAVNTSLANTTVSEVRGLTVFQYTNILSNKKDMGFLAHEVQEVYPFLVEGEKDGDTTQSLNYQGIIAVLVKEIQDLKKRVAILEQK
jgi:hypothetical protein